MVDGVLLLVDASEGLPQTRFVLERRSKARLPVILVVNKVDRPDARIKAVVDEVYELFLDLDADESQIEFPIVYCNAKAGRASLDPDPDALEADLRPLFDLILERIPAPTYEEGHPLQALVTNLDASPYVGRLAVCRVLQGTIERAQQIAWCRADGTVERAKVTELYVTEALDRVEAEEAGRGDHRGGGNPRGDDRRDARRPRRRPSAPGHLGRRAVSVGHRRDQHVTAGRAGRRQGHRHSRRSAAPGGARRQRLAARSSHGVAGRVGGTGSRRAPTRDPRRADAPRGDSS